MSLKSEMFHAVQCDFPGCGELYDYGDYTYTTDPYSDAGLMRDSDWCISEILGDFCADHTEMDDHSLNDEGECVRCGETDEDGWCAKPVPDTPEGHLRMMVRRVTQDAERAADQIMVDVARKIGVDRFGRGIGGGGTLRGRTDQALNDIHRRACLAIRPDLTARQIAMMQKAAA